MRLHFRVGIQFNPICIIIILEIGGVEVLIKGANQIINDFW